MDQLQKISIMQRLLAIVAVLFGLVTIIAGTRVLGGADPGYVVFRPLLVFNVAMGIVYVLAGVLAWRNANQGKHAAAVIFILNAIVLGSIWYLYVSGSAIAIESLRAMSLRTVVWLLLFIGLAWISRREKVPALGHGA